MKPGAKRKEQAMIYNLMQQEYSAKQISKMIQVYETTVQKFMDHFKDPKNLPKTSAFSAIKDGMPELKALANVNTAGLERDLARTQSANEALTARIEALEALLAPPTNVQKANAGDFLDGDGE